MHHRADLRVRAASRWPATIVITVTPLRRIPTAGGDVLHALKATDPGYAGFGEIYFSWVDPGAVKAWKLHRRMTLNLVVPVGDVRFVFHREASGTFTIEDVGEHNYVRLTAPPGVWFGFKGLGGRPSLVTNLADIEHDPEEVDRRPEAAFAYEW
jgi:dTDP-4-dehydrorhamnose 3,5-epimerase